ncbi:nitroreductase family protein [Acinetobacter indicus]|uniref:nitroreductase family protein n=1 Tax=Acinetobacter indicus TaxID=756892 RepID=UPI000CECB38A|nr:nitroreductase family protein [Acinetobacter indicus]
MEFFKEFLTKMGLDSQAKWVRNFLLLGVNYLQDAINYFKHSSVFSKDKFYKMESDLIIAYHSIEKGFLHEKIKPKFAKDKVKFIISIIPRILKLNEGQIDGQILVAINVLIKYYEYHKNKNINISDYFSEENYNYYKKYSNEKFNPSHLISRLDFYKDSDSNFLKFSSSRKSIRNFNGEKVSNKIIHSVIELANNAPSVCNRQSSKVYLVNDKAKINSILKIQGGFTGYEKNVGQILILVSNKNCFYSIGERNQMYIDGGIYLMNLLYSLHFYGIAACPANWGKCVGDDKRVRKYLDIPMEQQIICIVPIGYANEKIAYANSERRPSEQTLEIF